jgi:hypothetical protein
MDATLASGSGDGGMSRAIVVCCVQFCFAALVIAPTPVINDAGKPVMAQIELSGISTAEVGRDTINPAPAIALGADRVAFSQHEDARIR